MVELLEYVSIGTWTFNGPASACEEFAGLWTAPEYRGKNRTIPGVAGEELRPRVAGPILFVLPVVVFGHANPAGTPYTDIREGLRANIAAMQAAVLPASGSDPTRPLVHHLPDGTERQANCLVDSMEGPAPIGAAAVRFGLIVRIPSGTFTVVAP